MWAVVLLSAAVIGAAMLVMAVGLFANRPCLRGSCGGPEVTAPDGVPLGCAACPNRRPSAETRKSGAEAPLTNLS